MKFKSMNMINVNDWDDLVVETYGKPYSFQQQDGCKGRGTFEFTVPLQYEPYDFEDDNVPEIVNADEMGVSFEAWVARDPLQEIPLHHGMDFTHLWWYRNFYPSVDMIIADLHKKGKLPDGDYCINIDW